MCGPVLGIHYDLGCCRNPQNDRDKDDLHECLNLSVWLHSYLDMKDMRVHMVSHILICCSVLPLGELVHFHSGKTGPKITLLAH